MKGVHATARVPFAILFITFRRTGFQSGLLFLFHAVCLFTVRVYVALVVRSYRTLRGHLLYVCT